MFTLVKFNGEIISEHLNRQAAYNAMMDAIDRKIPCHIEATCGQSTELAKACKQKAARKAYAFDALRGQRKEMKPSPMKVIRDGYAYTVPVEMLKNDGSGLKKSAIKVINNYFSMISTKAV